MKVESSAFANEGRIPAKYTFDGENVNPELVVSEIPPNAKSLVLIVDDPDAQRVVGYTWIHWIVFDVPVEVNEVEIKENSIPGTSGESTYKKKEYGGPNPPAGSGIHNYFFKIYALNKKLDLPEMAPLKEIEDAMKDSLIESAELVGRYWRD